MKNDRSSFAFKLADKVNKTASKEKWKAREGVTADGCSGLMSDKIRMQFGDSRMLCSFDEV